MSSTRIITPLKNRDSTKAELRMVGSPLFKDHHPPHSLGVLPLIDTAFDEFPNPNCQRVTPGDNCQNTPSWSFLPRQRLSFEIISIHQHTDFLIKRILIARCNHEILLQSLIQNLEHFIRNRHKICVSEPIN